MNLTPWPPLHEWKRGNQFVWRVYFFFYSNSSLPHPSLSIPVVMERAIHLGFIKLFWLNQKLNTEYTRTLAHSPTPTLAFHVDTSTPCIVPRETCDFYLHPTFLASPLPLPTPPTSERQASLRHGEGDTVMFLKSHSVESQN